MDVATELSQRQQVLYRMFDTDGHLLYVGITAHVPDRLGQHRRDKAWWREIASITLEHHADRESVETAEREAIAREAPRYNIALVHSPGKPLAPGVATPTMLRLSHAVAVRKRAEAIETEAILSAVAAGEKQIDIAAAIGRSREYVRLLLREAGVEPSRRRHDRPAVAATHSLVQASFDEEPPWLPDDPDYADAPPDSYR